MAVDWAGGLPIDLLGFILKRMETSDQARFACVCTRWLAVAKQTKLRRPPRLPWVMLPSVSRNGTCTFFGFPEARVDRRRRTWEISLPEYIWTRCVGSSPDGWLVVLGKNRELCVVNPLTRERLVLPPIATIREIAMKLRSCPSAKDYSIFIFHYFKKAIMFELHPHGLMVAAIVGSRVHWLVLAKVGGEAWTAIDMPAALDSRDYVEDIAFYGGKVYGITDFEKLLACVITQDSSNPPVTAVYQVQDRPSMMWYQHLVSFTPPRPPPHSSSMTTTNLLVIYRYPDETEGGDDHQGPLPMHVMRLEQVSASAFRCVDDVVDLGGHAIFLDEWCCCMAVPVEGEFPEVKENYIYSTRVYGHVCMVKVENLESQGVETHHLSEVEVNHNRRSIWCWPVPKF